jgi:hypothetical protein
MWKLFKKLWSNKRKEQMTSEYKSPFDADEMLEDDEWEDNYAVADILKKYPESWKLVKAVNFTYGTMDDMKQWCKDNTTAAYAHVGWESGCSYTVGVIFESHIDAILFKLTWSGE